MHEKSLLKFEYAMQFTKKAKCGRYENNSFQQLLLLENVNPFSGSNELKQTFLN